MPANCQDRSHVFLCYFLKINFVNLQGIMFINPRWSSFMVLIKVQKAVQIKFLKEGFVYCLAHKNLMLHAGQRDRQMKVEVMPM